MMPDEIYLADKNNYDEQRTSFKKQPTGTNLSVAVLLDREEESKYKAKTVCALESKCVDDHFDEGAVPLCVLLWRIHC